jgi:hemerythrin-like metal-binding protein
MGIPEIDFQNQRILIMVSSLYLAENKNDEEKLVHMIYSYMAFHFRFIETLLALYDYPDLKFQKESHRFYLYQINKYILQSDKGKWNKDFFLHFIISWFTEHTIDDGKKWAKYITRNMTGEYYDRR